MGKIAKKLPTVNNHVLSVTINGMNEKQQFVATTKKQKRPLGWF